MQGTGTYGEALEAELAAEIERLRGELAESHRRTAHLESQRNDLCGAYYAVVRQLQETRKVGEGKAS